MLTADQIIGNSMDFDLQEIIENRQNNQESGVVNVKEENVDSQTYEDRMYTDITLDDSVEKQLNNL